MSRSKRPTAFEVSFPDEAPLQPTPANRDAHGGPLRTRAGAGAQASNANMISAAHGHKRAAAAKRKLPEPSKASVGKRARTSTVTEPRYVPRGGEFREHKDLVIVGEDDDADADGDKPVRVLSDFTVFDPKHGMEVVSLGLLEAAGGEERHFEAAGLVAPVFANEEDAGQEDDIEEGADDAGGQRLRTTALFRYTLDYTLPDDPLWIETQFAWYSLRRPSRVYKKTFTDFYRPHRISQIVISSAEDNPAWTYDDLCRVFVGTYDELLEHTLQERDFRASKHQLRSILEDIPTGVHLATHPIIATILDGGAPIPAPARSSRITPRPARRPVPTLAGNLDLAVLRPENQNHTHVTPLISQLAQGLFREGLEVVGPPPRPTDERLLRQQRKQRRTRLLQLLAGAGAEQRRIVFPARERLCRQYWKCVDIDGKRYSVGDVVLTPAGPYASRKVPSWPTGAEELPESSTVAQYFWFARILYIDSRTNALHVQWFEHASHTLLQELADPQELFLCEMCGDLACTLVAGKAVVHRVQPGAATKTLGPLDYFYTYAYNDAEGSFTDVSEVEYLLPAEPPENCPVDLCAEQRAQNNVARQVAGGVAYHGECYHPGDFMLVRADEGPAHVCQIIDVDVSARARDQAKTEFVVRALGRISAVAHLSPGRVLKDERHLFVSDEAWTVPLASVLRKCRVVLSGERPNLRSWLALSPYHFYVRYHSRTLKPTRWESLVAIDDLPSCSACDEEEKRKTALLEEFLAVYRRRPLNTFDPFAGVGAFSHAMEELGCLKLTHAVEISLSTAKTLSQNSPNTAVYNQCANIVLKYAIKTHAGHDFEVPKSLGDKQPLSSPPRPGDIDCIVAGFPCQPHSRLNMFQRADDRKSHLILNLLSWVDFLRPKYCFFENVRGFLSYNINAMQAGEYRVEGGIKMGGLKFLVQALLVMGYQVRVGLLQAAHYGAPQSRVRFFLVAARSSNPLPLLPQPTHDISVKDALTIKLTSGMRELVPVQAESGVAPHAFVSIDDAISDLPQFHWDTALDAQYRRKGYCGVRGSAFEYDSEPRTWYQEWCRRRPTTDIQHINKVPKFEVMQRVLQIPLEPEADYRRLNGKHWEWQFSDPKSSVARSGFPPGLYGRLDGKKWFHTTVTNVEPTAKQSWVLHPTCRRILTVRELARSQGFPDHFVFYAIDNDVKTMHRQIGNAVPWPVAEALGRELREALFKKWLKDREDAIIVD